MRVIIYTSNEREVFKMECLYDRTSDCPYFKHGKCLLEDRFEPCVMETEVWDDDSYDYDDICSNGFVEDDSYDFDD